MVSRRNPLLWLRNEVSELLFSITFLSCNKGDMCASSYLTNELLKMKMSSLERLSRDFLSFIHCFNCLRCLHLKLPNFLVNSFCHPCISCSHSCFSFWTVLKRFFNLTSSSMKQTKKKDYRTAGLRLGGGGKAKFL